MSLLIALAMQAALTGVAHVVDGDTLTVGGAKVRLSGIDAPELAQKCGPTRTVACGRTAASWLRARTEGKHVACRVVDRDRYARAVAVCRLAGVDLGAALVEAGWATAYRQYSLEYVRAEERAKATRRGIWQMGFERPEEYRRTRRSQDRSPPDRRCAIKGNVSARGERIYHLPGSRTYADVRVDARKGERWFCSPEEAARLGWRPVR